MHLQIYHIFSGMYICNNTWVPFLGPGALPAEMKPEVSIPPGQEGVRGVCLKLEQRLLMLIRRHDHPSLRPVTSCVFAAQLHKCCHTEQKRAHLC